ncbi:hypothetical protein TNCV_4802451 [Trichonephila clavipes]|nr:hypothetical protein TNCV_4802451 [Trichonephila clavipes]
MSLSMLRRGKGELESGGERSWVNKDPALPSLSAFSFPEMLQWLGIHWSTISLDLQVQLTSFAKQLSNLSIANDIAAISPSKLSQYFPTELILKALEKAPTHLTASSAEPSVYAWNQWRTQGDILGVRTSSPKALDFCFD